jgi:hypothetical protein
VIACQVNVLRSILLRISERSGIHIAPHALRRTFATLALKAGMNPLHLQGLLGHSSLEMTRRYAQMMDEDLVEACRICVPVGLAQNKNYRNNQVVMQCIIPKSLFYTANLQYNESPDN